MAARKNRRHDVDVELKLERGQATTLIVGSVVALGAVFLVGVGVGRHLALPPADDPAPAASPTRPEPADDPAVPELTYHDALTKETVTEAPGEAPAPKHAAAEAPSKAPATARAEAKAAAKGARPSAEVPVKVHVETAEAVAAAAAATAGTETPGEAKAGEAKAAGKRFSVQVASSQKKTDIDRLARRLRDAGYDATIVPAEIPGRGLWYRLRVGAYPSREEAAMKQAELKVALDLSGLVVTI